MKIDGYKIGTAAASLEASYEFYFGKRKNMDTSIQPNRTVELLRNHPWNMQALICDLTGQPVAKPFSVKIEPITGEGISKLTFHATKDEAFRHARTVLGMTD